ncbi:DUF2987 domain-containing protein [Shewanella gaetbuli]|uniref:DUF2987 domain-containing protein n=1 Tax=Shewanella gaetbuli TaxID=220752 RepID=A0A9X2CLH6_9GAMM|nr:DUF2987 domain-containing protein [Shewanella gaetbuli]MCL1142565.1 DUF2987 domain-containing protein [Shewanella gaetbuli]
MLFERLPLVTVILCAFISSHTYAETVSLEYAGFYNPLKRVNKNNYPNVELVFSVPQSEDCTIISGNITTENETFPLTYNQQQRIYMPFDADLKSNRGLVNIEVAGDASQCGIAMQVRARALQQDYTQQQLSLLLNDMNGLLDTLQGFPMKYFRKPLSGLSFHFDSKQNEAVMVNIDGQQQTIENNFTLSEQKIEQLTELSFSIQPQIVSPWVE